MRDPRFTYFAILGGSEPVTTGDPLDVTDALLVAVVFSRCNGDRSGSCVIVDIRIKIT